MRYPKLKDYSTAGSQVEHDTFCTIERQNHKQPVFQPQLIIHGNKIIKPTGTRVLEQQ